MQPRYKGLNQVLSAFDKKAKAPYFSMWSKGKPIEQYTGDDLETAKELISDEIKTNIESNYNEVCEIYLHTDKPKGKKKYEIKDESYAFITFVSKEPSIAGENTNSVNWYQQREIENLKSEIEGLKMRLQSEEIESDEEEEEEPENLGMIGQVNQLLAHPIINGLIDKWLNGSTPVRNLAGIPNDVEECVNVLFSKGVTLNHLKKLASMPETKIKMLLTML